VLFLCRIPHSKIHLGIQFWLEEYHQAL